MMDTIIPKILTFSLESSCISVPSYICALSPLPTLECCTRTLCFCNLQAKHNITTLLLLFLLQSRGSLSIQMGPGTLGGAEARGNGQSLGRRLSISLGENTAVFQAEIYAILAYAYEIQMNNGPEKSR
jgi:hypothetical protein